MTTPGKPIAILRAHFKGDRQRLDFLRRRYVQRTRAWVEQPDLRTRDWRLTYLARRMKSIGLYAAGNSDRMCRFGIVKLIMLWCYGGRHRDWHRWTMANGWGFIFPFNERSRERWHEEKTA